MVTKEERLIYACSGAADLGEISDKVARKLRADGVGLMSCLSAIGADLPNYIQTAKTMPQVVAIDGCPMLCAKKQMERIGVQSKSFILTDLGYVKGKTPPTDAVVKEISDKIRVSL